MQHRPWTLPALLATGQLNALMAANWQRGGGKSRRPKPITPPEPVRRAAGQRNTIRQWRRDNVRAAAEHQRRLRIVG